MVILTITACSGGGGGGLSPSASNAKAADCQTDMDFMANSAWPRVLSGCAACHNAGGPAGNSAYILTNSSSEHQANFDASKAYHQANGNLLVEKPLGQATHAGGAQFASGDTNEAIMLDLISRFSNPISECANPSDSGQAVDARSLNDQLILEDPKQTYRRVAMLLAGKLPTESQLSGVNEDNLKSQLRSLMSSSEFDEFLMEAANDQLLTMKWAGSRTPGLSALNGDYFYPQTNSRIGPLEDARDDLVNMGASQDDIDAANVALGFARSETNIALAEEPLRLIAHIVQNEQHYGNILTADYIMVNPFIDDVFASNVSFSNDNDPTEWKPGYISSGYRNRTQNLPHAGILSSPMFLARYPSTDTNRNRARARWTYYFFLGVDIEGLATRPMNGDSLMDEDNPTLNNPDCATCHEIMDPVAGAFQNWGDEGQFRDQCGFYTDTMSAECDRDALPSSTYKDLGAPYVSGDLWYRDMRAPGFNNTAMPSSSNDHSLRWLGEKIKNDDRFAEGTVKFWFKGLLGRDPAPAPGNAEDVGYLGQQGAYELDRLHIENLAQSFAGGTAGTASNGNYNLKDLFVDMLAGPLFRAQSSSATLSSNEQIAAAHMGSGRLLTPEQLNRKIETLVGNHWPGVWNESDNQLLESFYGFYGGIDSDGITERNTQLNALMSTVIERLSHEMVCRVVIDEFEITQSNRLLFPHVSDSDTPSSSGGEANIKANLGHLITRLWGEQDNEQTEIDAAYNLFVGLRNERINGGAGHSLNTSNTSASNDSNDEYCNLEWNNDDAIKSDSNHVMRPWMGVLMYMLTDYRMIYL